MELSVIVELVKNARRSDRELARVIGVSQPTVTRIRTRLEREKRVDYAGTPDLAKLGFSVMAVTVGKRNFRKYPDPNPLPTAREFTDRHPQVIFAAVGEGLGYDRIIISIHEDYSAYSKFMKDLKNIAEDAIQVESFLVDTSGRGIVQPLSLKRLVEQLIEK